ncbi:tetratricopeptide repeat protein [Rhodospirillum sp. A1_3_36]|uniref:tetratricopeptide repeat protein n=1 Tax=Rhodospirillum sp. A1_3_36 TaxID=3391666 RepID=UPI0039A628E5
MRSRSNSLRRLAAFGLVWLAAVPLGAEPARALGDSVSAEGCALAVGGDISESDIKVVCGIPAERLKELVAPWFQDLRDLSDSQKELLGLLREKLRINEAQIRSALEAAGETSVPPERIAARLVEIAQRYRDLQAQLAASPGDAPETEKLKAAARDAVEAGDLDRADRLLEALVDVEDALLDKRALAAAAARSKRAEVALLRLRYLDAADLYGAAAERVPPGHDAERRDYLWKRADALYRQGREFGDNEALAQSIQGWQKLLLETDRASAPDSWAMTQNNLGNALWALGAREKGTARLEEAILAYRSALEERTRDRVPLYWATTHNNLGNALRALGAWEKGTARLDEAVLAYRSSLEEYTRDRVPLNWAATQNNLGNALQTLGEREEGTARLEEAVLAYRSALEERTRDRVPLGWAATQNNLGNALQTLGVRENGMARLEEAVLAYRSALEEYTRDRVPLYWATTQNNLGNALRTLGERESGTARLEEAVLAYRSALEERTRDSVPRDWARTQKNLGLALMALGTRTQSIDRLHNARDALEKGRAVYREAYGERYDAYFTNKLAELDKVIAGLSD